MARTTGRPFWAVASNGLACSGWEAILTPADCRLEISQDVESSHIWATAPHDAPFVALRSALDLGFHGRSKRPLEHARALSSLGSVCSSRPGWEKGSKIPQVVFCVGFNIAGSKLKLQIVFVDVASRITPVAPLWSRYLKSQMLRRQYDPEIQSPSPPTPGRSSVKKLGYAVMTGADQYWPSVAQVHQTTRDPRR